MFRKICFIIPVVGTLVLTVINFLAENTNGIIMFSFLCLFSVMNYYNSGNKK
jgi:hypothetical protein